MTETPRLLNNITLHFRIPRFPDLPPHPSALPALYAARGGVTSHYILIDRRDGTPATADTPREHLAGRAGFAVCHPGDNYNRRLGHALAKERATAGYPVRKRRHTFGFVHAGLSDLVATLHEMAQRQLDQVIRRGLRNEDLSGDVVKASAKLVAKTPRRSTQAAFNVIRAFMLDERGEETASAYARDLIERLREAGIVL